VLRSTPLRTSSESITPLTKHIGVIESRGDVQLRSDALLKLAKAFGISVEELAGDVTIKSDTPEEILERLRLVAQAFVNSKTPRNAKIFLKIA